MTRRAYVSVIVAVDETGRTFPLKIRWEEGKVSSIDRLLDVRKAASTKAGGQGIRYTCRILGRIIYLFEDEGRWFVESKDLPESEF